MEVPGKIMITVDCLVNAPSEKVWKLWTTPLHIMQWNNASETWHTPIAENDLKVGGKFLFRMEAKDGSFGFDFIGVYDEIEKNKRIAYTLEEGRKVVINFVDQGDETGVVETFEPEHTNSIELQKGGWQSILDNFKKYVESN